MSPMIGERQEKKITICVLPIN